MRAPAGFTRFYAPHVLVPGRIDASLAQGFASMGPASARRKTPCLSSTLAGAMEAKNKPATRQSAPGPALGPARLATLRVLTGAFAVIYFVVRAPVMASFQSFRPAQFEPVGLARILESPLPAGWVLGIYL